MQKATKSRTKLSTRYIVLLLCILLLVMGILLSVRINKVRRISDELTTKSGTLFGLSDLVWYDQSPSKAMIAPTENHKYITVSLGVTNRTKSEQWVTPVTQAYVTDSQAQHHGIELVASDSPFQAGPLAAGQTMHGDISFMVPSNDTRLELCYQLDGVGTDPSCISLNEYNRK